MTSRPGANGLPFSGWLRIAVRLSAMLAWLLACITLFHAWKLFGRENPWSRAFLGGVGWIAGAEVTVKGERAGGGAFLLANHVSWLDIPAISAATGSAFVAHSGLAANPVMRWLCEMNDTVFVARHDRGSVAQQVQQVRKAIRETGALTIFPEGTTSDGVGLLPFKSSLLSALTPLPDGVSVQPVLLDYGAEAQGIAWVGDEPGVANFLKILARSRPVKVAVHLLPPLTGDTLVHRKTIASTASAALDQTLRSARA